MQQCTTRSGREMSYQRFGNPAAAPAIVIHGMAERGDEVVPLAQLLASGFNVVVPDLPGHGGTPGRLEDLTIPALAEAVAEFMTAMQLESALVIGHSLGATVATELAATHPELVSRAVLLDPGMGFPDEMRENLAAMYDSLTPDNFDSTLNGMLPAILFGPDDPQEMVDRVMAGMTGIGIDSFVALGRGLVAFDGFAALGRVKAPTLLIVNESPLPDIPRLRAAAPHVEFAEVIGVSHQGVVTSAAVHAKILGFVQ